MTNIEYHRLEEYNGTHLNNPMIICSFETDRFGYFQIKYSKGKLKQLTDEPSIKMFSEADQLYIWHICAIVYRMVYDVPAAKNRFRKS